MKYYKIVYKSKCPKCGEIHKLQYWSKTQGGLNGWTVGYTESKKTLRELNNILDRQTYICKCGYIKGIL